MLEHIKKIVIELADHVWILKKGVGAIRRIKIMAIGLTNQIRMKSRKLDPARMWGRVFDLRKKRFVELNGYGIYVMPNDYIGRSILDTKTYEPHVTALIRSLLKRGEVFLDLGANLGYFSLLASFLLKAEGKVIAFEPNPQNLQLIYASVLMNGFTNVKVYPYAVSDSESILRFTTVGSNGGVVTNASKNQRYNLLVKAVVLDEMLKNEPRIDFVKIDIEAHEPSAIRGMAGLIKKHKPKIITEFHPWAMRQNNVEDPVEYLHLLYSFGYSLSIIEPSESLSSVSCADEIMNYWKSQDKETIHLDLLAQPCA